MIENQTMFRRCVNYINYIHSYVTIRILILRNFVVILDI